MGEQQRIGKGRGGERKERRKEGGGEMDFDLRRWWRNSEAIWSLASGVFKLLI